MNKFLLIALSFVLTICLSPLASADNNQTFQISSILSGKLLVVDINNTGSATKDSVFNGTDLVLGEISNDTAHKFPAFKVETIGDVADLAQFDSNHDGIIEKDELAKSNIVLIRFAADHSISIIPLALSNIQEIHYQGGLAQSKLLNSALNVWLSGPNNKKFFAYYVNF